MRGVPDGTAAAPGIAFETDPNTGIYRPGADQLAVATNGTGRLFVDANGIVSVVGASTITTNLTVNGGTSFSSSLNWNFPGLLLRRTASNIATAKQISLLLDGDTESDTTLTNYLNIWGTYSGTPTTSSTSTGLSASMNLGAPNAFIAHTNGSERLRIDSSGRLLVSTSTSQGTGGSFQVGGSSTSGAAPTAELNAFGFDGRLRLTRATTGTPITVVANNDIIGRIAFDGYDGSAYREAAKILGEVDGTPGASDMPGRLVFSTTADGASSPTERMRIGSTGIVTHNSNQSNGWALTTKNAGDNNDRFGLSIWCGTNAATGTNYAVEIADCDGTSQGFITFTGCTVTYGAFTAHHPCILPEEDNEDGYLYGTLLETVSIEYTQKDGVATERGIQYVVRKTQVCNSKAVLGAYGSSMNNGPTGATNLHQALVLGDGHILCNGIGGNIKAGDGICSSSVAGIGQKAIATPSMIIGIAQECVTFEGNEVKLVAVQYGLQQFMPWQD